MIISDGPGFRIIPCLDIKDGRTVKGVNFKQLVDAGDPVALARWYANEGADELVFLDIGATVEKRNTLKDLVSRVAQEIHIPFTVGGGVRASSDVYDILRAGADKISINSAAVSNPTLLKEIANNYGSQCLVLAVDATFRNGFWQVFVAGGTIETSLNLFDWVQEAEQLGVGEILFTSMDHDGTKGGYALEALAILQEKVSVPVIASGGAGCMQDFADAYFLGMSQAALAASLFHFREISIPDLKQFLASKGIHVRLHE